jgi:8-oxo-dGTP diphosphatase
LTIYLIRHAKAGDRHGFDGPDHLRPLSKAGRRQASAIAATLADAGVAHIVSSPFVRCRETVTPLGDQMQLTVELSDALAEGAGLRDALRLVEKYLHTDAAFCSHGDVLGDLVHHYASQGAPLDGDRIEKASIWVLRTDDGEVRDLHYLAPPQV